MDIHRAMPKILAKRPNKGNFKLQESVVTTYTTGIGEHSKIMNQNPKSTNY